jgi:dienelactone hydrolase
MNYAAGATVIDRFKQFPAALAERARTLRFGGVPVLLAHPDWERPAPVMVWMHGRTANKELDPGRYLRWIRAGIGACAVDLPGHGERFDPALDTPAGTLEVIGRMRAEIDPLLAALAASEHGRFFDISRAGIGGMSAGGMTALRRVCDPHAFRCAAVEGCTGELDSLFGPGSGRREASPGFESRVAEQDPLRHLVTWRPIPLLALHSEADRMVPIESQRRFMEELRQHYREELADPELIRLVTWPTTGAPDEHTGFGRVSNEAKNLQTEFLRRHLVEQ